MTGDRLTLETADARAASIASMLADIHAAPLRHIRAGLRASQNPPIYLRERPRKFLLEWCRAELSVVGLRAVWEHVDNAGVTS